MPTPFTGAVRTLAQLVATVATLVAATAMSAPVHAAAECFWPPVDAPIVDHFRDPACPYCAGNRGLEYTTAPGTPVRAVAAGTVTFAGDVAGTRYLVIQHADGRRATYGRLATINAVEGTVVAAGSIVATTTAALYLGLREGEVYVDPEPLLGRLRRPARLVPIDGTAARPPAVPTLTCAAS
jgi:septal ring factor EnvC (AmiA/AmiB activator)